MLRRSRLEVAVGEDPSEVSAASVTGRGVTTEATSLMTMLSHSVAKVRYPGSSATTMDEPPGFFEAARE